jgi:hypothetical protein
MSRTEEAAVEAPDARKGKRGTGGEGKAELTSPKNVLVTYGPLCGNKLRCEWPHEV